MSTQTLEQKVNILHDGVAKWKAEVSEEPVYTKEELRWGPDSQRLVSFMQGLVDMTGKSAIRDEWESRLGEGIPQRQAEYTVKRYRRGVEKSIQQSSAVMSGEQYNWWDIEAYRKRIGPAKKVVSEGQFVNVLGEYALVRVGGAGAMMHVGHEDLFEDEPQFLDALTNATVNNMGHAYPLQMFVASEAHMLTGGAICNPYTIGPWIEEASRNLIKATPIEKKGAKVSWFNSGGSVVSIAVYAAEKYVIKEKGANGKRSVVYFREAYHGNRECMSGMITTGIDTMYHDKEKHSIVMEYPNRPEEAEPILDQINQLADDDKISCVVYEATQGDGGGVTMDPEYFVELVKLSLDKQVPLICDEVQSGFARSGKFTANEHLLEHWRNSSYVKSGMYPEHPPIIYTYAKAMTNGAATGSAVVLPEEYAVLKRAEGLNTYSAYPQSLAATLATLDLMRPELMDLVAQNRAAFDQVVNPYINNGAVREVRGSGLHTFVIVDNNQAVQIEAAGTLRLFMGTTARNATRIHAPLNAPEEVWQACAYGAGEIAQIANSGKLTAQTSRIMNAGPSGLAVRNID